MSANPHWKDTTIQPLCETVQHGECELLPSTAVVIPEQQSTQQLGQENEMRKKKCRGNRKRQRYRRQLYNQGFDSDTVAKLVEEKFHPQVRQQKDKHDLKNIEISLALNQVCFCFN